MVIAALVVGEPLARAQARSTVLSPPNPRLVDLTTHLGTKSEVIPPVTPPTDGNSRPAGAFRPSQWFPRRDQSPDGTSNSLRNTPTNGSSCFRAEDAAKFQAIAAPSYATAREHPTVFIHLPPRLAGADRTAQFQVLDAATAQPLTPPVELDLGNLSGVLGLRFPSTMPLAPNRSYRWILILECDRSAGTAVGAIIQRRTASVSQQPVNRATLEAVAQADLWYDAVDILVTMMRENPDDPTLRAAWADLMQADWVNLETLTDAPLAGN